LKRLHIKWLILVLAAGATSLLARQASQTLKVNVEVVQVYATVTDGQGRYVKDLKKEHFEVSEDGAPQTIETFSSDDVPVSVGIVLDVGGQMKDNLPVAREGALTFLKAGHLDNEFFLVEFNNKAAVTEDYARDLNMLRNHNEFLPSNRQKAVYDAIYLGLTKLRDGINPRKLLLVLTSGGYLSSEHKPGEVRNLARQLDAQIFGVDLPVETDIHGDIGDEAVPAADVIEPLGGQNFISNSGTDYLNICRRIAVAVRNQYAITYRSTNPVHDGKYRKISVKLNPPKGTPQLLVQTRNGYYAPEP
jgi:Ca-activated chloride channel family protein